MTPPIQPYLEHLRNKAASHAVDRYLAAEEGDTDREYDHKTATEILDRAINSEIWEAIYHDNRK